MTRNPFRVSLARQIAAAQVPLEARRAFVEALSNVTRLAEVDPDLAMSVTGKSRDDFQRELEIEATLEGITVTELLSDIHGALLRALHVPTASANSDTLGNFFRMGAELWYPSFRRTRDMRQAVDLLFDYALEQQAQGRGMFVSMMMHYATQLMFVSAALWADSGFPVVELTPGETRELSDTPVEAPMTAGLRPPFPAFVIQVAPGEFATQAPEGRQEIRTLLVCHGEDKAPSNPLPRDPDGIVRRWSYTAVARTVELTNVSFGVEAFADEADNGPRREGIGLALDADDTVTHMRLRRVIFHVCHRRQSLKAFGKAHNSSNEELRRSTTPVFKRFRLSKDG